MKSTDPLSSASGELSRRGFVAGALGLVASAVAATAGLLTPERLSGTRLTGGNIESYGVVDKGWQEKWNDIVTQHRRGGKSMGRRIIVLGVDGDVGVVVSRYKHQDVVESVHTSHTGAVLAVQLLAQRDAAYFGTCITKVEHGELSTQEYAGVSHYWRPDRPDNQDHVMAFSSPSRRWFRLADPESYGV